MQKMHSQVTSNTDACEPRWMYKSKTRTKNGPLWSLRVPLLPPSPISQPSLLAPPSHCFQRSQLDVNRHMERSNQALLVAAVVDDPSRLRGAVYSADKEFVLAVVAHNGPALEYAAANVQADKEH